MGESISIEHEKIRIENAGRKLVHLIQKIPDKFGVGYDIRSFLSEDENFDDIHIEVKTTLSKASSRWCQYVYINAERIYGSKEQKGNLLRL